MDLTVYLPDGIGLRAKKADPPIKFSRLLREAVLQELREREAERSKRAVAAHSLLSERA